jgi:D-glycero-D-manno-heptose 1,7-bisphosphate phosphatase
MPSGVPALLMIDSMKLKHVRRAIFFDRDGVLNLLVSDGSATGRSPRTVDEFEMVNGAEDSVRLASQAGFLPIVITNQPEISRGDLSSEVLDEIHSRLRARCPEVIDIYACPHTGSDCNCRKPRSGLLEQAAFEHKIRLHDSWMIGDRWIDVSAGQIAGCRSVLIERPYSWLPNSDGAAPPELAPTLTAFSALCAVRRIVAETQNSAVTPTFNGSGEQP